MNNTFIKENVELDEYYIHILAKQLGIPCPRIILYDSDTKQLQMEKINGSTIADMYGATESDIDESLWTKMRNIIKSLYFISDIVYPDITGYNFIEDPITNKLYIIDFGHAYLKTNINSQSEPYEDFVLEFINGNNLFNPDFA